MSDEANAPGSGPAESADSGGHEGEKKKKKKDKVRAAWISFVGRILAQFVGAAATIALGLLLVQKYQTPSSTSDRSAAVETASSARVTRAAAEPSPGTTSLAVLPLDNLSADPNQDYFADGTTEALIGLLGQIDGLRVISRTSTTRYKGERKNAP